MGDRSSTDKRFQKIKVSWKIEKTAAAGHRKSASSQHRVVKAKMGPIDLQNHREVQRSQRPSKRAAVRQEMGLKTGRLIECLYKEQLVTTSTEARHSYRNNQRLPLRGNQC